MNELPQNINRLAGIKQSASYRSVMFISKLMDRYCLDPIIGLLLPGYGDVAASLMVLPYIYLSLFKVKSLPLTLAVVFNTLVDVAVGLLPVLGDMLDFFHRSYAKNSRLIQGFVEGDKAIIGKVNRQAAWLAVLIVVVAVAIYWLAWLAIAAVKWIAGLLA